MEIRQYQAETVSECLSRIKAELGSKAMIISVNENKGPTVPRSKRFEVTAMPPEEEDDVPVQNEPQLKLSPEKILERLYAGHSKVTGVEYTPPRPAPHPEPRPSRARSVLPAQPEYREPPSPPAAEALELTDLLVDDLEGTAPEDGELSDELRDLARYFLDIGVNREITSEMIWRVSRRFKPSQLGNRERVREYLAGLINSNVRCDGALVGLKRGRKRNVALIGPTGVGKTTTIAKIATELTAREVSVGLIVLDNFRVGAVDQLRKFATTIDVPLLMATNDLELRKVHRVLSSKQVILIDTAGQNPHDQAAMDRLFTMISVVPDLEKHLVLSANTKERDLQAFTEIYLGRGFSNLIFTKLDESLTYGGLLNTYFQSEKPFSYFGVGQRVPDDLLTASSSKLAELLLM